MGASENLPDPPAGSRRSGSIGALAGTNYLGLLLGVVTGPLIARAVGPVGRGEIAAAVVYSALAAMVMGLGLPLAIGHSLANRLNSRGSLLMASVRFSLFTIPVSLLLAYLVVQGPLANLTPPGRAGTALLMATAPISVFVGCLALFFVGEGALRGLAKVQLVPVLLLAGATVAAFVAGRLTVLVYLFLVFVSTVVAAALSWREAGSSLEPSAPLKPLLQFGLRGYAGHLAVYAVVRVDQAIIGPFLGSRLLGFYAVAASIAVLPVSLARAIASRAFATLAEAPPHERAEVISSYLRMAIIGSAVTCAGVAAVSPVLVPLLYGGVFEEAVLPLLILLPGSVALCGSVVGLTCLSSLGRPGRSTIAEMVGLAITLVGLPLVVFRYGIVGAAAISTLAYAITFGVYLHFLSASGPLSLMPRRQDFTNIKSAVAGLGGRFRRSG